MVGRITRNLDRNAQKVEILASHLQKDLALSVELERLFERLLDLVIVIVVIVVIVVVRRACVVVVFVWAHGSWSSHRWLGMQHTFRFEPSGFGK